MTYDNNALRHFEIDHTNLDISFYKEEDQPPVTPTFVMIIDNLTSRAISWWLEWPDQDHVGTTSFGTSYTSNIGS